MALLVTCTRPLGAQHAQRASLGVSRLPLERVWCTHRRACTESDSTSRDGAVPDSLGRPDKTPWVLAGAIMGGIIGLAAYRSSVNATGDGDFAAYGSVIVYAGGGALLGGLIGYIIAPSRE